MNAKIVVGAICVSGLVWAAEGEGLARLSDASLRRRFSEVRQLLGREANLVAMKTGVVFPRFYDTLTKEVVICRSDDLDLTLDPVSGRILSLVVKRAESASSGGATPAVREQGSAETVDQQPKMGKAEARTTAERHVRALGSIVDSTMATIWEAHDASTMQWQFTWQRCIDGHPFPEETIYVAIDDADAGVVEFRDATTDKKCPTKPIIAERAAKSLAESCIKRALPKLHGSDYAVANVSRGKLHVVYPNRMYLLEDGSEKPASRDDSRPRLAYCFTFTFAYTGTSTLANAVPPATIWVDAISGFVIGGV